MSSTYGGQEGVGLGENQRGPLELQLTTDSGAEGKTFQRGEMTKQVLSGHSDQETVVTGKQSCPERRGYCGLWRGETIGRRA